MLGQSECRGPCHEILDIQCQLTNAFAQPLGNPSQGHRRLRKWSIKGIRALQTANGYIMDDPFLLCEKSSIEYESKHQWIRSRVVHAFPHQCGFGAGQRQRRLELVARLLIARPDRHVSDCDPRPDKEGVSAIGLKATATLE